MVLDLATAVKELLENALDAGATQVEVRLREYGSLSVEVVDNGPGIAPHNFQGLCAKYHTSKIEGFGDLESLTSFGFRGEALSSLCSLATLAVVTRTAAQETGTRLEYDGHGALAKQAPAPRGVGTTVTLTALFAPLPVRHKDFVRNLKREYGRTVALLQAYALIAKDVRLVCTHQPTKGNKTNVVRTQGTGTRTPARSPPKTNAGWLVLVGCTHTHTHHERQSDSGACGGIATWKEMDREWYIANKLTSVAKSPATKVWSTKDGGWVAIQ